MVCRSFVGIRVWSGASIARRGRTSEIRKTARSKLALMPKAVLVKR
jgi:hypothetical protein